MASHEQFIGTFLMMDIMEYIRKTAETCKPILVGVVTFLFYILFPEPAYLVAFQALLWTMGLDFLTKVWAIRHDPKAKLSSKSFMSGTLRKIFAYMAVFILTGLSYRVAPVASAAVFLGTFVYTIFFLREAISVIENLCDAGHDLDWLLLVVKKRHDKVMEDELNGVVVEQSNIVTAPQPQEEQHPKKGGIQ